MLIYLIGMMIAMAKFCWIVKFWASIFSDGYGLEFSGNSTRKDEGRIYNRLKKSYTAFLEDNKNIPIPTVNVDLATNSFERLISEVIRQTNEIR